jgi:hypothetical protein
VNLPSSNGRFVSEGLRLTAQRLQAEVPGRRLSNNLKLWFMR